MKSNFYEGYNIEQNQKKKDLIERLENYATEYGYEAMEQLLEEAKEKLSK